MTPPSPVRGWPLWPLHLITGLTIALVFGLIGSWAALTRIDSALTVPAYWTRAGTPHHVQHPQGGKIVTVLVDDDTFVTAGTALLQLDDTALRTEAALIATERRALEREALLLAAERSGTNPPLDPETARQLATRRQATAFDAAQLATRHAQTDAQITALTHQRESIAQQITLIDQSLATQSALVEAGLAQHSSLRALQAQAASLAGEDAALTAAIAQARAQKAALDLDHARRLSAREEEITATLAANAQRLATLAARASVIEAEIAAALLRAPAEGRVAGADALRAQMVLAAGATALTILPPDAAGVVRADIAPRQIGQVSEGQTARLYPSGRAWRDLPPLTGMISRIATDPTPHPVTGDARYTVEITLPPDEYDRLAAMSPPRTGEPVEAHLLTGRHSVLSYLLAPLAGYLSKVFRES